MKKVAWLKRIVWWLLAAATSTVNLCLVFPALLKNDSETQENRPNVLRIWNVDTFEGGKGSRTSFLNRAATEFEKRTDNLICIVSSKTLTGLQDGLEKGDVPDLISFGVGAGCVAEYVTDGEPSAWCRGGYALFSRTDDFSAVTATNCVVSKGGENLSEAAAALNGMTGSVTVENSTTAYVRFLNGDYQYLLGTQRDVSRFASRGVSVYCQPVDVYDDLFQYIGVTAKDENIQTLGAGFIDYLMSEEKQKELTGLGMLSTRFSIYDDAQPALRTMEGIRVGYTVHPYTSASVLAEIGEAARSVFRKENVNILKKFLKSL